MEVIYLDIDEEITSVIDRIRKTKVHDLVLVIPKRASLTQSIVNLKLLKKQISLIGKRVIIVAQEKIAYNLAKRAGLAVRSEIPKKIQFQDSYREVKESLQSEAPTKKSDFQEGNNFGIDDREVKMKVEGKQIEDKLTKENQISKEENFPKVKNYSQEESAKKEDEVKSFNAAKEDQQENTKKKLKPRKKIVFLPKLNGKIVFVFVAVSMLITGLIFFFLLPKATITVFPKTEQYLTSFDVVVEKDVKGIDLENNVIPGEVVFVEENSQKKDFETKGIKDIGEKARGEVVIYNAYSSSPQPLVKSTRLQSSGGKIYRIINDISVPGATIEGGSTIPGRIKVVIEGDSVGEEYNGANGTFSIPGLPQDKQKSIYGEAVSEFSGGKKGTIRVLSAEDLENAKNDLVKETAGKAYQKLKTKTPKEKVFFENAAKKEIIESKSSREINEQVDNFSLEIKVRVSTLVFDSKDMEELISTQVAKALNDEKTIINPGIEEGIDAELLNFDFGTGKMGLKIKVEKTIAYKLDLAGISENVKGRDENWIREYILKRQNVKDVEVSFWPFWVKKAPRINKKIDVVLDNNS